MFILIRSSRPVISGKWLGSLSATTKRFHAKHPKFSSDCNQISSFSTDFHKGLQYQT
jgi:hypothetical protein